jgi:hypothetical protein
MKAPLPTPKSATAKGNRQHSDATMAPDRAITPALTFVRFINLISGERLSQTRTPQGGFIDAPMLATVSERSINNDRRQFLNAEKFGSIRDGFFLHIENRYITGRASDPIHKFHGLLAYLAAGAKYFDPSSYAHIFSPFQFGFDCRSPLVLRRGTQEWDMQLRVLYRNTPPLNSEELCACAQAKRSSH